MTDSWKDELNNLLVFVRQDILPCVGTKELPHARKVPQKCRRRPMSASLPLPHECLWQMPICRRVIRPKKELSFATWPLRKHAVQLMVRLVSQRRCAPVSPCLSHHKGHCLTFMRLKRVISEFGAASRRRKHFKARSGSLAALLPLKKATVRQFFPITISTARATQEYCMVLHDNT